MLIIKHGKASGEDIIMLSPNFLVYTVKKYVMPEKTQRRRVQH